LFAGYILRDAGLKTSGGESAMAEPSKPTHDVFLSYSSKDKTWADAACVVLERHRI
jgi:hypothetical protein